MCGIFLSRLIFLYFASSFVCGEEGDFIGQMARWAVKFPEEFDDANFSPEEFEPSSDDDYMAAEPQYCLVLTARVTVEFTHNNSDHVVEVPVTASNGGACEHYHDEEETLRLWWPAHGGINAVSITIARNGRVAYFSSASATVTLPSSTLEMTPSSQLEMAPSSTLEMATNLSYHGFMAPGWPLRYRLTCGERIKFPLYTVEQLEAISQGTISSDDNQPKATLHIHEDLELEAFRTDTEFPGPYGRYHSRTDFGCQFIQIYPAAPYMTALALVALLIFDLVAYYFRKRLGFKTHERAKISVNNNE